MWDGARRGGNGTRLWRARGSGGEWREEGRVEGGGENGGRNGDSIGEIGHN